MRPVRMLVLLMFLYGAETSSLLESDRRRVITFKMWVWCRMLRIPRTARTTSTPSFKGCKLTQDSRQKSTNEYYTTLDTSCVNTTVWNV